MKIGIITHYYKSTNYGGNLQAYALCRALNDFGCQAEQIAYDKSADQLFPKQSCRGLAYLTRRAVSKLRRFLGNRRLHSIRTELNSRKQAILQFNETAIPHSVCYHRGNIAQANGKYDIFITGSDQVWHPKAVCGAYLLDFVWEGKTKLSYAASVSTDSLPEEYRLRYQQCLADFDGVSVREADAVELIRPLSPVEVKWVLDPVFLLEKQQWDEICPERKIEEPYLFCYFLGEDHKARLLAREYAEAHGLKLVTLPHLSGKYISCDVGFGDRQLYDVSPGDFVSLIRYAECVLTDSFHATAFSIIYEREFFVLPRSGHRAMGTRIQSLTGLIGAEAHFCAEPEQTTIAYLKTVPAVDYSMESASLATMKKASLKFLSDAIQNAEKKK